MSGSGMSAWSKRKCGKKFLCRERSLKVPCGRTSRTAMKWKLTTRRLRIPSRPTSREDHPHWPRRFRNIGSTFRSFGEPESAGCEDPFHFLEDLGSEWFRAMMEAPDD